MTACDGCAMLRTAIDVIAREGVCMPRTGEQVQLPGIYRGVCEKRGHIEQGKFFDNGPDDRFNALLGGGMPRRQWPRLDG